MRELRPYIVTYGRFGVMHKADFDTLEELAEWVEDQEDREQIFAAGVEHEGVTLFDHEHPPAARRWIQNTDVAWPGKHP